MSPADQARACPQCGKSASGNFCQHCGAALGGRFCNQCGSEVAAGARFCNQCGSPAGGGAAAAARGGGAPLGAAHREAARAAVGGSNLPWWIAGVAMFGLILAVGLSVVRSQGPAQPAGGMPVGAGGNPAAGTSTVDINSMTPLEAADRLFERVMITASAGDSAGARAFVPMAISAYERAQPLNLDGLLHVSLLQSMGSQFEDALTTAEQILDVEPDHLLGLTAAADADLALGRLDEAEQRYQRFLDVYDEQMTTALPEYEAHQGLLEIKRAEARAFLAGR